MKNIKRSTIIIFAISLAVLLISIPVSLTPSSSFCRLCHGGEYKSWKSSSHKKVSCNSCHRSPDFFAFTSYRMAILRMIGSSLTGSYELPVRADVPTKACRACHSDKERKTLVVGGLRMSHKEPLRAGYECTLCHNTVVHGKLVPDPREVDMNSCFSCHNGEKATATCEVCHSGRTSRAKRITQSSWQITHGRKWRELHGMGNLTSCSVCHRSNFCARCHGTELPHAQSWLNIHGRLAKQDRKSCLTCHREELCNNCHKTIEMPHTSSFLAEHAEKMKKLGRQKCLYCHLEQGCDSCHNTHIHPGLPPDKLKRLKREIGLE